MSAHLVILIPHGENRCLLYTSGQILQLRREPCLQLKDLAVNGNDLLALGYSGREIGLALQRLLQKVVAGEIERCV